MAQRTTANRVKEELRDRGHDVDDDEFEELVEKYEKRFGDMGDEGFAAFAVAKEEYGEKIQGEFTVSSGGTPPEDQETYSIEEIIENGEQLDEDSASFKIRGIVIGKWFQTRDDGEPRWNIRIYDGTAQLRGMASGVAAADNFSTNPPEVGDFVEIQSAQVFHSPADGPEDDAFNLLMFGQYAKYNFDVESDFDLRESITTDVMVDPANDEDMVYVEGVVADHDKTQYEGCVECNKGWDPDELNACPNCGATELAQKQFDTLKVRGVSDTPMEVQLGPAVDLDVDDPVFDKYRFYGVYNHRTDDGGSEVQQVDVVDFLNLSAGDEPESFGGEDDEVPEEDTEEEAEVTEKETQEDDEADEGEDDEEEAEEVEAETSADGDYDIEDLAQAVEDQVEDMEFPIPATSPRKILTNKFEIPEEEVDDYLLKAIKMAKSWGTITVEIEDGDSLEDARWQDVILELDD